MAIYFILLALLCGLYLIQGRHQIARPDYLEIEANHRKTIPGIVVFCGILAFMIAFRGPETGIDTFMYQHIYETRDLERIVHSSLLWTETASSTEPGYTILMYLFDKMGMNFRAVTIFEGLIYIIPVGILIYRYSRNPYFSLFLFVCFDYFCFSMSALRQSIAIGICIIGFLELKKGKKLRFILLTLLACSFHKTAICFLPVILLEKLPLNKKTMAFALVSGGIVFIMKEPIRDLIRMIARINYEDMDAGGNGMYLFLVSMVILDMFVLKDELADREDINLFRYMLLVTIFIFPVLQFNPTAFRLHFYYSINMIVYFPNVIRKMKNLRLRLAVEAFYVMVAVYYLVQYPLSNLDVVPYSCTLLM